MPMRSGATAAVEESSDDDDALLQRHAKRIAGAQGVGERMPRRTAEQQTPKLPAAKAAAKPQEPGPRQSFRGPLAFNPLRAPAAAPRQAQADSDSDEERWQRIKAEHSSSAAVRRLSAAAPNVQSTGSIPVSGRKLSLLTRPAAAVIAKPTALQESDSDEEQWQRVKKMASEKPKQLVVPTTRASLSGRLSMRAAALPTPGQAVPKAESDSDDERWAQLMAARSVTDAGPATRNRIAARGQPRGAGQPDSSDSDEEQWRRVKVQVTARPLSVTGQLPRESRTSIRPQARLTGDVPGALTPRQRRSASMLAPSPAQSVAAPATVRRASMPQSHIDAAQPGAQAGYARGSSFVLGGLPVRRTIDDPVLPLSQPTPYQVAARRAPNTFAEEGGSSATSTAGDLGRRVSSMPAYPPAIAVSHRRASSLDPRRATAKTLADSTVWNQSFPGAVSNRETAAGGPDGMSAPQTQQSPQSYEQPQLWHGDSHGMAVHQRRLSMNQLPFPASRRESVAAQQEPQMRGSRLSLGGMPQEVLRQADGAILPPPTARPSFAAARRASAPVNSLPHIPEEPQFLPASDAPPRTQFSKRRSSAHPSLGGSGRSSVSLQMQPDTPQRLHEVSRRSSLAPVTAFVQPPLQQDFNEAPPPEPDSFDAAAFSAAYSIEDQTDVMTQEAAAEQEYPLHQEDLSGQPSAEEAGAQGLQQVPLQHSPEAYVDAGGRKQAQRGTEGSLRRADDSFTFSVDAPPQHHEFAHLPEMLPSPGSFQHEPADISSERMGGFREADGSGKTARLTSEPVPGPTLGTNREEQAPSGYRQRPTKQGTTAQPSEPQSKRRASRVSSGAASVSSAGHSEEQALPQHLPAPAQMSYGRATGGGTRHWRSEQSPSRQQEQPAAQSFASNPFQARASMSAGEEDLSSVRATVGSLAWNSIANNSSVPMRQTGDSLTWTSRSLPASMTAGQLPAQEIASSAAQSAPQTCRTSVARSEGLKQDVQPSQEGFTVYDNQVAATTEAAEQLLQSAAIQPSEAVEGGQEPQSMAMDRDALEVVIMHAVQASMTSAFASLATDVQQLDAKLGAWWQRSEDMCTGLQQEISQLRRGTADDIGAIGARLALLEAQENVPSPQPESKEPQEAPVTAGSGWDEHFTMDIIERLDALETRVASQLDQLTSSHEERISAIKGNLHASVAETAAAASSRPASPTKNKVGAAAAEKLASSSSLERSEMGKGCREHAAQADAPPADTQQSKTEATLHKDHAGGVEALAKRVAQLEASYGVFMAADRSTAKLAVTEAVTAATLDKRLCTLEEHLHSAHSEAADASSCARGVQQRMAAAEWRIEKVATACAATVKALTTRQERLANSLSMVKGTASLADAKCMALGAEIARLYRDTGLKRAGNPGCSSSGKKVARVPRTGSAFES